MDTQKLDRLAWAGAETPPGLGYTDTLYFLCLRALYRYAKATGMPPEQGRQEKAKIEEAVRSYRADAALAKHHAEVLRDTGAARAEYRKARKDAQITPYLPADLTAVIAAADKIVEALDGMQI